MKSKCYKCEVAIKKSKPAIICELFSKFANYKNIFEFNYKYDVLELSEQEIGRRQSLQELREMGINPYPAAEFPTNAYSTDIKEQFKEGEQREVVIAGRMMGRRVMGKASFAELQDSRVESRFISLVTISVRVRIKNFIIRFSRSCSILVTSSE